MRILLLVGVFFVLSAFSKQDVPDNQTGQPSEERKVQDALPQSRDPIWKLLGKTVIHLDKKAWRYSADIPPEVKDLVGKQVTITGFVLPLEDTEKFTHFLISKRTPTCSFCPPGEPSEIVDVVLEKPMKWDQDAVTVVGIFGLMENEELGLFFKLDKAVRQK